MPYPKVVALDTDWTIWHGSLDNMDLRPGFYPSILLDHTKWGQGPEAYSPVKDNIERVNRWLLRDRTNHKNEISVYEGISDVVHDIIEKDAKLAIVSRNTSKDMCDRALYYFNTTNPRENNREWSIIHLVDYDEVKDESKVDPFRRIQGLSQSDYSEMIIFDDEAVNNEVKITLGVTFQLIRDREQGMSSRVYQQGIEAWQRARKISPSRGPAHTEVLIGYSGLSTAWISRVNNTREGLVDRQTPYRWGYGLYITDSIQLAKWFCDWDRGAPWFQDSYVCQVWVKDYSTWANFNKIWVREFDSRIRQMDNVHWSPEEVGMSQENRDSIIARLWSVHTPYVLFSRHHWMEGMPLPEKQRFNEMIVYTQVQRSLFKVVRLDDAQLQNQDPSPYPFHRQIEAWNIKLTREAKDDLDPVKDADVIGSFV